MLSSLCESVSCVECEAYACDKRRMLDVFNSYGGLPVVFVRWNPDAFKLAGHPVRCHMTQRLLALRHVLHRYVGSPPRHKLTICRMYFDREEDEKTAVVTHVHPDDPFFRELPVVYFDVPEMDAHKTIRSRHHNILLFHGKLDSHGCWSNRDFGDVGFDARRNHLLSLHAVHHVLPPDRDKCVHPIRRNSHWIVAERYVFKFFHGPQMCNLQEPVFPTFHRIQNELSTVTCLEEC